MSTTLSLPVSKIIVDNQHTTMVDYQHEHNRGTPNTQVELWTVWPYLDAPIRQTARALPEMSIREVARLPKIMLDKLYSTMIE